MELAKRGADLEYQMRHALAEMDPEDPGSPLVYARQDLKARKDIGALEFLNRLAGMGQPEAERNGLVVRHDVFGRSTYIPFAGWVRDPVVS
jgi:hypothetical protein